MVRRYTLKERMSKWSKPSDKEEKDVKEFTKRLKKNVESLTPEDKLLMTRVIDELSGFRFKD